MSNLSDIEQRQKEDVNIIFEELSILNFAEANMCFFGLTDSIKKSNIYIKIQKKRTNLLEKLSRHVYIIEKLRHDDYISMLYDINLEAVERINERDEDKFYKHFPAPENFQKNDDIERDIAILELMRFN